MARRSTGWRSAIWTTIGRCAPALESFAEASVRHRRHRLLRSLAARRPGARLVRLPDRATILCRNPRASGSASRICSGMARTVARAGDVRYFEFPKGEFSHVIRRTATDTSDQSGPRSPAADRHDRRRRSARAGIRQCLRRALLYVSSTGAIWRTAFRPDGDPGGLSWPAIRSIPRRLWTGQSDQPANRCARSPARVDRFSVCDGARLRLRRAGSAARRALRDRQFHSRRGLRKEIVVSGDGSPLRSLSLRPAISRRGCCAAGAGRQAAHIMSGSDQAVRSAIWRGSSPRKPVSARVLYSRQGRSPWRCARATSLGRRAVPSVSTRGLRSTSRSGARWNTRKGSPDRPDVSTTRNEHAKYKA